MHRPNSYILNVSNYDPFGMLLSGRIWEVGSGYRYGFNGMEKEQDECNCQDTYTTLFRHFDSRIGRWWSMDPKAGDFVSISPYTENLNNPIFNSDPNGDCPSCWIALKVVKWVYNTTTIPEKYVDAKANINNPNNATNNGPTNQIQNTIVEAKAVGYAGKQLDKAAQASLDVASSTPATETVGDLINVVYNYATGDYTDAKLYAAALIIPGVSGSMLRSMKGAYTELLCIDYADSFMKRVAPQVEKSGGKVIRHEFKASNYYGIGYKNNTSSITTNGRHQVIEVIKDGNSYIFDNIYPEGILKSEWEKGFEVYKDGRMLEGMDVWQASKTVE